MTVMEAPKRSFNGGKYRLTDSIIIEIRYKNLQRTSPNNNNSGKTELESARSVEYLTLRNANKDILMGELLSSVYVV